MEYAGKDFVVGDTQIVSLEVPACGSSNRPGFTKAKIAPGRGMMTLQLRARMEGTSEFDVLYCPPLEQALRILNDDSDRFGNASFSFGAAVLVPFANRVRGRLSADGRHIEAHIDARQVHLPANWGGRKPGAERYAMHGLILSLVAQNITHERTETADTVMAELHAGNFGGHWVSSADLIVEHVLAADVYAIRVTARNSGKDPLPIGIGWHPYFALPSGARAQARLRVPAHERLIVNNYDDVLPTGEIIPVKDTAYDFSTLGGKPLGEMYLDDCFVGLEKCPEGETVTEITDPQSAYGVRVVARSSQVRAIQVFAPPDKPFIVVEPQFNWADPFGKQWPSGVNTGMIHVQPNEAVTYSVELRLFVP